MGYGAPGSAVVTERRSRRYLARGCAGQSPVVPYPSIPPLELVHVDFTSIEMTMELNRPPSVKNVLVLTNHFMRYAMAFIAKDQKANTVAHILYEQFITVFGMPTKLLSDLC